MRIVRFEARKVNLLLEPGTQAAAAARKIIFKEAGGAALPEVGDQTVLLLPGTFEAEDKHTTTPRRLR